MSIQKVEQFLKDSPVFYLSTIDGDRPKCRPLGLHLLIKDKIYFGVGSFKNVYAQMQINPNVEICVCRGRDFLRYYGRAIFEPDDRISNIALTASPFLQRIYNETTGNRLAMFHLEEATAEFYDLMEVRESYSL